MKFQMTCDMPDDWAKSFISMIMDIENLGDQQRSAIVGLFADGSNGFHPHFEINLPPWFTITPEDLPYGIHIKTNSIPGQKYYHTAVIHRPDWSISEWADPEWEMKDLEDLPSMADPNDENTEEGE